MGNNEHKTKSLTENQKFKTASNGINDNYSFKFVVSCVNILKFAY